jgi:hypothetical protein
VGYSTYSINSTPPTNRARGGEAASHRRGHDGDERLGSPSKENTSTNAGLRVEEDGGDAPSGFRAVASPAMTTVILGHQTWR